MKHPEKPWPICALVPATLSGYFLPGAPWKTLPCAWLSSSSMASAFPHWTCQDTLACTHFSCPTMVSARQRSWGSPGLHPLLLQKWCKGALWTENSGTSWPTHYSVLAYPPGNLQHRAPWDCPVHTHSSFSYPARVISVLGNPESLTCIHCSFSYPVRVSTVQRTLGTLNPQLASAPHALQGHPLWREPQKTLADTSASSILLWCPLCVETQDTPDCIHFSFSSPARGLGVWRAQDPHQPASTPASVILPSCMESTRTPCFHPHKFQLSCWVILWAESLRITPAHDYFNCRCPVIAALAWSALQPPAHSNQFKQGSESHLAHTVYIGDHHI